MGDLQLCEVVGSEDKPCCVFSCLADNDCWQMPVLPVTCFRSGWRGSLRESGFVCPQVRAVNGPIWFSGALVAASPAGGAPGVRGRSVILTPWSEVVSALLA